MNRFLILVCSLAACTQPTRDRMEKDIHSYSNIHEISVRHLDLDLTVDFDQRQLAGTATWSFDNPQRANQLILDTRNLVIERVESEGKDVSFHWGDSSTWLGRACVIPLSAGAQTVTIHYRTGPGADALQWLAPEQTAGGNRPFLFTQSQAILARTWIPCQDAPAVRFSYSARIRCPNDLLAVMSAENPVTKNSTGEYTFKMEQRIPSYLMALGVGDLEFRSLGARSGVYAEPAMIDKCVYEFADTEMMIEAAERLYGPYRWVRYDLLVLPPSFPFGGMENPRLTFATPTILAGDRSLVSLVSHELAHSWSGNLVTNATWNDFWLNEGFTTYFERRIDEALYGRGFSEMQALLGKQDLQESIEGMGHEHRDTWLSLDLAGRDPDEGVGDIAYEKGYFFLRLLEESVGREKWDAFLNEYFASHAFQTMTTTKFLGYLGSRLTIDTTKVDINRWVYGPGLPSNCPQPESNAFADAEKAASEFAAGKKPGELGTHGWVAQQWIHFLRKLPTPLTKNQLADLDAAFRFTESGNSEIQCEWFQRAIENDYRPAFDGMRKYLLRIGRRKLVRPLYMKLAATESGKSWAKEVYSKARPGYHSVTAGTVDAILNSQ